MLLMLGTGKYTLEEVANKYDLTRERIRQIWKKNTGRGYDRYQKYRRQIKEEKEQEFLDSVKYICLRCGKEVTHRESWGSVYCFDCRQTMLRGGTRNYRVSKTCLSCSKKFHPWTNANSPSVVNYSKAGQFCSRDCYRKSPAFFGGWLNLKRFSEEKIIDLVCKFIDKEGRLPKYLEITSKEVGVSNSTLYKYFSSIPELWKKAMIEHEKRNKPVLGT